jgi:hypothetical protein
LVEQLERVVSPNPAVDTVKSNDSDKTLSGSSDSIGTAYRLDSQDSTTSVEGISFSIRPFQLSIMYVPYSHFNLNQDGQRRKGPSFFQRLISLKCLKCQKIQKIPIPSLV